MGFSRNLLWLVFGVITFFLIYGCGDLEPEIQDTRAVVLKMDFNQRSSSRNSSVSQAEVNSHKTHLILALPTWENLSSNYRNYYSNFAQELMNPSGNKVSLEIPLNTQMKIFAFLLRDDYTMPQLLSGVREVGYYGESQPFSIGTNTNNLRLSITLQSASTFDGDMGDSGGGGNQEGTDTSGPTVLFSPANGTVGIAVNDNITITFSEAVRNIDDTILTNSNIDSHITLKLNNVSGSNISFDATINTAKTVITINPTRDLFYSQTVYLSIGSTLEDYSDNLITAQNSSFSTVIDPSLEAYYPFNGNANDESGNSYHGQLGDNVTTSKFPTKTTDRFGNADKAFSFDGGDYIEFNTGILSGDSEFSILIWINTNSTSLSRILQQRDPSGFNGEYMMDLKTDGKIRFFTYSNGYKWDVSSSSSVNDGSWHHFAFVQKDNGGQMYLDGILEDTDNSSGKVNLLSTIKTYVGADFRDLATSPKYFSGKVDNLRIYSRSLSASEIQAFFNN